MLRDHLAIAFDCTDLPDGAFLTAAEAWTRVRTGGADAQNFGHGEARGLWFLRVNVHRDRLALANTPTSDWDTWRDAAEASKTLDAVELVSVDQVAALIDTIQHNDTDAAALTHDDQGTIRPRR